MKFLNGLSKAVLFSPLVLAAPLEKQKRAVTDADILQFALTLEHLENVFYKQALTTFSYDAFIAAGLSPQVYQNLQYVAMDEEQHTTLLYGALQDAGVTPVEACTYSFPFTDPLSFYALASIIEGVGVSAYLGAAPLVTNPEYLAVAGSILVTEAWHNSFQRYSQYEIAPGNPYGTAMGANEVYTLASAFIVSCPASNPTLPFTAFPALTAVSYLPTYLGVPFTFTTDATLPSEVWVTFLSGLSVVSVPGTVAGTAVTAAVPEGITGQSYALLTSSKVTTVTDADVIAGPAIIEVVPPAPVYDVTVL